MANSTQNNRPRAQRRGVSRFAARRRLAGVFAALTVMVTGSATLLAQLDPLLFIKRVPPTVIIVMDTSLRMLEDGNGTFYDPTFYKVSDDLTVMGAFPNVDTATTKTYRTNRTKPAVRGVAWQVHRRTRSRPSRRPGIRRIR